MRKSVNFKDIAVCFLCIIINYNKLYNKNWGLFSYDWLWLCSKELFHSFYLSLNLLLYFDLRVNVRVQNMNSCAAYINFLNFIPYIISFSTLCFEGQCENAKTIKQNHYFNCTFK